MPLLVTDQSKPLQVSSLLTLGILTQSSSFKLKRLPLVQGNCPCESGELLPPSFLVTTIQIPHVGVNDVDVDVDLMGMGKGSSDQ